MHRRTLNLGILAHVDAGKTTLSERLLYAVGVIDEIGSVDRGTTQTDSLALEQQRGITIKSAVVSFAIDDITVDLIDTPGHPDFIAEVERVLGVLDGVVLVISAVEGVQSQTRTLMRALQRLQLPTLLFVNKIDRSGADFGRVLAEIRRKLTPMAVAMTAATGEGTRAAAVIPHADTDPAFRSRLVEALAEHDDGLLRAYLDDETIVSPRQMRDALADQAKRALVHPVFCGSALTGAGIETLLSGIAGLLPATAGDPSGPASGLVFKIERGPAGDRIAYVRMFSGTIHTRDRVHFGRDHAEKVTAIAVFGHGTAVQRPSVAAGEIAKVWGLTEVQIGDSIGDTPRGAMQHEFPPPTLESDVAPAKPADRHRLRAALAQLAEQDPLINVRHDDARQEISVSLYGDVQKEVIQATLANDYGIDVTFHETTPIYVERPVGTGEAIEYLHAETNPFFATIGLRVEPAANDSGIEFRLEVDPSTVPLYVYKTLDSFCEHMDSYVRRTLREGLFGWQVTDCLVTLTKVVHSVPDGPPSKRGPLSTAADFRKLTPIVLMEALEQAGTVVCEPIARASVDLPAEAIGALIPVLVRLGAAVETPSQRGEFAVIRAVLPAARLPTLQRQLPELTGGEAVLESTFTGYQAISGDQPARRRTTASPLNLNEYMMELAGRGGQRAPSG